jgi:hypothetical protein
MLGAVGLAVLGSACGPGASSGSPPDAGVVSSGLQLLLRRGVLSVVIGVGYDDSQRLDQSKVLPAVEADLRDRGFTELSKLDEPALTVELLGIPATLLENDGRYFVGSWGVGGVHAPALIRLIEPNQVAPKAQFVRAVRAAGVFIYAGHGRLGTGPDFDAIDSGAGNVVFSKTPQVEDPDDAYTVQQAAEVQASLASASLDTPELASSSPQLGVFLGCTTRMYIPELRPYLPNLAILDTAEVVVWPPLLMHGSGVVLDALRAGANADGFQRSLMAIDDTTDIVVDGFSALF